MPLDATHQHSSDDIMQAASPHTPIDPSGWLLVGLMKADEGGEIPNTGNFTTIAMLPTYDPAGYYSANLPNAGVPGFLVPLIGDGVLHRVSLSITFGGGGDPDAWVMAAISPTVTLDVGDVRDFSSVLTGHGEGVTIFTEFVGVLSVGDEVYFYAKQVSVAAAQVRVAHATIERLAS